jgi:(1->4)-alpha-D-glucan 1-alpha-D-glucosylmutase
MLVGAWPPELDPAAAEAVGALAERIEAAMIKSVREGKEHSSWSYPDENYEAGVRRFVRGALDAARPNPFLVDFAEFSATLARPAAITSLAQLVVKLTAPGVPDIYQGCELWDLSLVDPDNRRPVDFAQRQTLLEEVEQTGLFDLRARWRDGREKLFVTARLLALRREYPDLFAAGDYQPLEIGEGRNADRLCAFARRHVTGTLIAAVPRLVGGLCRHGVSIDWGTTDLAVPSAGPWRNIFTAEAIEARERIRAGDMFRDFPVAVLIGPAA